MILREVGTVFLAGLGAGIVTGVGSRLAMKISALASPSELVRITSNGNVVGDLTVGGTFALLVFAGIFPGILAGGLYGAVRPWLARLGPWDGLAFGTALLVMSGSAVLEPENADFRRFGPPALNVLLFGALFGVLGLGLAAFRRAADRLPAGVLTGAGALGALAIGGSIVLIGAAVVRTVTDRSQQALGESALGLGLIVATTFLALVLRRTTGVSRASAAALAVPVLIGGVVTIRSIAFILTR